MNSIPANAECVFKGKIFSVWQWQQKMYDGSFSTFEKVKRLGTVQVIALQEDEIVFAEQQQPGFNKPFYSLLGGRMDVEGESAIDAAKRELKEEAGLESNDWELLSTFNPHGKIDWDIHLFVARNCKKVSEQKLDAGEKITIKKLPINKFMREIVPHKDFRDFELKNYIMNAFNEKRSLEFESKLRG